MREPLPSRYDPSAIEAELYAWWEEKGYFTAQPDRVLNGQSRPYGIVIPPPNVTSVLHMGHGLNNTLQDVLTRWRRMQGREALYLPGTDHAGIATQNVVERQLAREGLSRHDLGRDAFVERVWSFVDETGSTILRQLKAIGCSCDWSRTRFTLDPALSRAVREVFVRLFDQGLIYRGTYIVNWCPRCLTALSDEEAEPTETQGHLWHLRYPLAGSVDAPGLPRLPDGRPFITVATTRPETMLGDTAVAVHPKDERYAGLVGAEVELPLTGRRIPIIADEYVDPTFGSGALKITPAHDPNDFQVGRRHELPEIDVMRPDAILGDGAPEAFRGLDRFEARKRVVADFEQRGLLDRVEEHTHNVPRCYRCHTIVEPRLSLQWFVRMKPLAEPALRAAREGRVRFTPERHLKVYENWMENIRDWCISRQLWWGHRIPVWYCGNASCEHMFAARTDPETCPKCGGDVEQDSDVLDTWFSSWLWPFSTLGWPEETDDLKAFYPTQTLVTAPEILFFWVARMIMAGLEFMGEVPFADVYLNGTVRDMQGRKMSKSLGNGIDPLEVVRNYGADALRFTVIDGQGFGTDLRMDHTNLEETFKAGRNFANKVWNAGRLVLMNVEGGGVAAVEDIEADLELADRWILSRLSAVTADLTRQLEAFRFHEATEAVYHFFWGELADWYLEMVKPRLREDADAASRGAARATLVEVLDQVLRLLHPFMPFLTEALWQRLPVPSGRTREESLVIARWPEARPDREDAEAETRMTGLMELIGSVRGMRSEYNVPENAEVDIVLCNVPASLAAALAAEERALRRLARVRDIDVKSDCGSRGRGAGAVLRGGAELLVPLAGIIDVERERERLNRELDRLEELLEGAQTKLGNEKFTSRAPEEVVQREREKALNLQDQRDRLASKLSALA